MRPALAAAAACASAGRWPTPSLFLDLELETGSDLAAARKRAEDYAAALGTTLARVSGETSVIAALRAFQLGST